MNTVLSEQEPYVPAGMKELESAEGKEAWKEGVARWIMTVARHEGINHYRKEGESFLNLCREMEATDREARDERDRVSQR